MAKKKNWNKNLPVGTGARFKALKKDLMGQGKSAKAAGAIAAAAGRAKYGPKKMAQMSAAGRKRRRG